MDLRVIKSQKAITDAFLEIRTKKELRKITVKEICEKAMINKSTFYSHYNDIYDLSDKVESEIIISIVNSITHPEYIVDNPSAFSTEMMNIIYQRKETLETVFSGDRKSCLVCKISDTLRETIHQRYPQTKNNVKFSVALDYMIYGMYYAFEENLKTFKENSNEVVETLMQITNMTGKFARQCAND